MLAAVLLAALPPVRLSAQTTEPPAPGTPHGFELPAQREFSLENGMDVTLVRWGDLPKALVQLTVRTGNVDEDSTQVWLADVVGDLLTEGTRIRPAERIAREAAGMGGQVEVGVGADQSFVSMDVLGEFVPQAVALVADVARNPASPARALERVKQDRIRTLSIELSQPQPVALERWRRVTYPNHPYGRIYPTEAMLQSYDTAAVRRFYQANWGADRAHLFVVGRFDPDSAERAIRQAFGDWARGAAPVARPPEPVSGRAVHLIHRPNAPQSTLIVGLPVIDPSRPDYVPLLVTNALLGGSFASRITSNIREQKGYTYSPFSTVSSRFRDAYWVEQADVTTAVTGASLKEIFAEIERLRREPPTEEELDGIQNYLAGTFVLQNSSRGGIANQLSFLDLHGLPDTYLTTFVERVHAVTPTEVQRIARQYLDPSKMLIVVVGDTTQVRGQVGEYGAVSSEQ